jgi:hypothetical protein
LTLPSIQDPNYSFRDCVLNWVARDAGCHLDWFSKLEKHEPCTTRYISLYLDICAKLLNTMTVVLTGPDLPSARHKVHDVKTYNGPLLYPQHFDAWSRNDSVTLVSIFYAITLCFYAFRNEKIVHSKIIKVNEKDQNAFQTVNSFYTLSVLCLAAVVLV